MSRRVESRAEQLSPIIKAKASAQAPHLVVPAEHVSTLRDGILSVDGNVPVPAGAVEGISPWEKASTGARALKRSLDLVGTIALAVLFAPLVIVASLVLARTGSVIYRHKRIGTDGQVFECLKFRTMIPDADRVLHDLLAADDRLMAEWLDGHKLRNDPRVTPIGRFLRRTSLDELPQLWNVFRGEMSLVGPRPITREELLRYGRSSAAYLSAKPGITGLWQTTGRNDIDYRRRVALDVYYVRNQNVFLDLYILAKTVRVVLSGDGAY
jgi:lipopolysaccharide/colanic/teichoic acid biosynthesis glycosyltransferase